MGWDFKGRFGVHFFNWEGKGKDFEKKFEIKLFWKTNCLS